METGAAYFDARAPRHYLPDLDDMVASGCTYVVHCFSEFDLLYAKESMRALVAATRERGLGAWIDPWCVGEVFGGEPFSRFGAVHPEARQIRSDGRPTTIACHNQPAFRIFVRDWIEAAAEIGGEVVFWDEPTAFLQGRGAVWGCRCALCQGLYLERSGEPMPVEYTPEVREFVQDSMVDLLGELCLHARSLGLRNALCVMPAESSNPGFTDWDKAAAIPGLDIFGSDPYWVSHGFDAAEYVARDTRRIVEVARRHGLADHVWVQAFEIPAGHEDEVRVAIEAAAAAGATNIAAWSYDGCSAMSSCTCERPELVWQTVAGAFRRLRDGG